MTFQAANAFAQHHHTYYWACIGISKIDQEWQTYNLRKMTEFRTLPCLCRFSPGWSKRVLTCPKLSVILKVGSNLFKFVWTCPNWSAIVLIRKPSHWLKFAFSEKATKLKKIFVVLLTRASCSVHATAYLSKSRRRFFKKIWSSRIKQTLSNWLSLYEIIDNITHFSLFFNYYWACIAGT